ncbi:sensor domain-containing diguanylate cyclase, partial [Clostridioides difficile]|uniref:sensor domain-containing diguanylate cyclase n=1 Tax=Clostridioides difficile TaxID=1496 RepID=UPI003F8D5861
DSNSDFNKMKNDIDNNLSGQIGFKLNGSHEYMVYIPIGQEDWYLLTFVPVSVVNAKSNLLLKITLLLCGFITLAFAILTIVLVISFYRHKKNLEQIAYVDTVTGGNTIQRFYNISGDLLKQSSEQYALVYMNIEKFKMLNDQFGREAGDSILRGVYDGITSLLAPNECMGRLFADNFCVLISY